jgi:hypothetical protein
VKTRGPRARALARLDALGPGELRVALECVIALQPHLVDDIGRIAAALSAGRDGSGPSGDRDPTTEVEAIASELEEEIVSLDILDLSRPPHNPFNYDDDTSKTWERLHQAVTPSVEAMVRLVQIGRLVAGMRVLQGVLLGLYRLREGDRGGELLAGVPEFPDDAAAWVWDTWQRTTRGRLPLPQEFVRHHLPKWTPLLRARRRR